MEAESQPPTGVLLPRAPLNEMSFSAYTDSAIVDPFNPSSVFDRFGADFPRVERQPPVVMPDGAAAIGAPPAIFDTDAGHPPRWWLIEKSNERLLQFQERFAAWNWRRQANDEVCHYLGFTESSRQALAYFAALREMRLTASEAAPNLTSAQLFYDNLIAVRGPDGAEKPLQDILTNWRTVTKRPVLGWQLAWVEPIENMPAETRSVLGVKVELGGRVTANSGEAELEPVLKLTFSAMTAAVTWDTLPSFFGKAHGHIFSRFRELLTPQMLAEFEVS